MRFALCLTVLGVYCLCEALGDDRGRRTGHNAQKNALKEDESCDSDSCQSSEESEEDQHAKKIIYVKKFAHEKHKNQKPDRKKEGILKMHKKAYNRFDDDDDVSEEVVTNRRPRLYDDDD